MMVPSFEADREAGQAAPTVGEGAARVKLKSTYPRQIGLLLPWPCVGCFVPAAYVIFR